MSCSFLALSKIDLRASLGFSGKFSFHVSAKLLYLLFISFAGTSIIILNLFSICCNFPSTKLDMVFIIFNVNSFNFLSIFDSPSSPHQLVWSYLLHISTLRYYSSCSEISRLSFLYVYGGSLNDP